MFRENVLYKSDQIFFLCSGLDRDAGETPGHRGVPGQEGGGLGGLHRQSPHQGDGHCSCPAGEEYHLHQEWQERLDIADLWPLV